MSFVCVLAIIMGWTAGMMFTRAMRHISEH